MHSGTATSLSCAIYLQAHSFGWFVCLFAIPPPAVGERVWNSAVCGLVVVSFLLCADRGVSGERGSILKQAMQQAFQQRPLKLCASCNV